MRGARWTEQEVETLKKMYLEKKRYKEIALALGRPYFSVRSKAISSGITASPNFWVDSEIKLLRSLIEEQGFTATEAAKDLRRHKQNVIDKARELGFSSIQVNRRLRNSGFKRCPTCKNVFTLQKVQARYCPKCRAHREMERRYASPIGIIRTAFSSAKIRALRKGISFSITLNQCLGLYEKQKGLCHYTGLQMTFSRHVKRQATNPTNVSIDRLNNKHGYTLRNVVLCCAKVNTMKGEESCKEFFVWCHRILEGRKP